MTDTSVKLVTEVDGPRLSIKVLSTSTNYCNMQLVTNNVGLTLSRRLFHPF